MPGNMGTWLDWSIHWLLRPKQYDGLGHACPALLAHIVLHRFSGSQGDRAAAAAAEALEAVKVDDKNKDKNKDKKQNNAKKPAAPQADRPVDISRVDLRVGLINKAWKHPGADR